MNTARISQAVRLIEENQKALDWLRQYGEQLTGRCDGAKVVVNAIFAGSCPGRAEAEKVMSSFARLSLPEVVQTAIRNCENTIALHADAIREEVGRNEDTTHD